MQLPSPFHCLLLTSLLAVLVVIGYLARRLARLGSAFTAKTLCSEIFVGGREAEAVAQTDLPAYNSKILRLVDWRLDRQAATVSAGILGFGRRMALFRPGLGCTLANGDQPPVEVPVFSASSMPPADDFPAPDNAPPGLEGVIASAFADPDTEQPRRTRALIVIQHGGTLVERYAPGYTPESRLPGWSMSKSLISALVGMLVAQGRLDLQAPAPVPEWADPADPRHVISLEQLLHMSSGLEFEEGYRNPLSDVIGMLYDSSDSAAYAAAKPLAHAPGTAFAYSTGSTAIVSRLVARAAGDSYVQFARRELFGPLGMRSALIEPDSVGTPLGSSFMWASARDWTRFGLLYLNEGVWQGRRLLPAEWIDYSRTPAPAATQAEYGAHFWLKVPAPDRLGEGRPHLLPPDAYHAVGYGAQFLTVIPSRDLVVVRLGLCLSPSAWDHEAFVHALLKALEA